MKQEILSNIVDEPKVFKTIALPASNWLESLKQKLKISEPEKVVIQIKGSSLRTVKKISLMILAMKQKSEYKGDDEVYDLVSSNVEDQAIIIATAVHNQNSPVPDQLINAILDNFTNGEIKEITAEVDRRLDIQSFFESMTFLKRLIIQTGTQETTANQPLSETSNSPTN